MEYAQDQAGFDAATAQLKAAAQQKAQQSSTQGAITGNWPYQNAIAQRSKCECHECTQARFQMRSALGSFSNG